MKRFALIFSTAFIVAIAISFMGCEEEPDKKDCEVKNYGKVIVKNKTGYDICVDVTEGSSDYNNEKWISPGSQTTYNEIDAGTIKVWASYDGDSWSKERHNLSSCEEFTYTWYEGQSSTQQESLALKQAIGNYVVGKTENMDCDFRK